LTDATTALVSVRYAPLERDQLVELQVAYRAVEMLRSAIRSRFGPAEELPELARWFVHGAARLVTRGEYDIPPSSTAALAEWRGEASSVALFLGDATTAARDASDRTRASHLYANYKSWCEANGHRLPMTSTAFGRALRDMGIAGKKSGGVMFYPLVILNGLDGAGRAVPLRAVS
jgi:hypothetical protein